jgi:predicted glutamine amidotransferase
MCRFLAYRGAPVFMERYISSPGHSLVHQSLHAEEAKMPTNGDGFGLGWYGDRPEPGLYRELHPAWSDENLISLCRMVRSPLFFAHVRAATGTATSRANCHPFAHGAWMFMHNGQIGGYSAIKRAMEAMLPDDFYGARHGNTDSELIFLLIMTRIEQGLHPIAATVDVLKVIKGLMNTAQATKPLRFAAALSDGKTIYGFRAACDDQPPSLYLCQKDDHAVLASEPVDADRGCWQALPKGCAVTIGEKGIEIATLDPLPLAA